MRMTEPPLPFFAFQNPLVAPLGGEREMLTHTVSALSRPEWRLLHAWDPGRTGWDLRPQSIESAA